jgi:hypothetical protein
MNKDCYFNIIYFLDIKDNINIGLVNKLFHIISKNESIWKKIIHIKQKKIIYIKQKKIIHIKQKKIIHIKQKNIIQLKKKLFIY